MKRNFFNLFIMLLTAGVGLGLTACSSDEEPVNQEPEKPYGDLKLKTVIDHPGIIHYDSGTAMWYIEYLRNRPVGFTERLYTEDLDRAYQQEGMDVLFSGEAFDFLSKKKETVSGEYDYYFFLQDISECNHLQPIPEIDPEIAEFFNTATATELSQRCQFDFPESTFEEKLADTCYVINDQAQLAALYTGEMNIPSVDFAKYTLILGRAYMSSSAESLVYHDISADATPKVLNMYIEAGHLGLQAIYLEYYWGLYPKFEDEKLTLKRITTELYDL